jgi:hypothetical protein
MQSESTVTTLEKATGRTLENHNISFEEVQSGQVKRPATPLPPPGGMGDRAFPGVGKSG